MDFMDQLHSQKLYNSADSRFGIEQKKCLVLQNEYNATSPYEGLRREQLLKEMFCEIGEGCYIEPPMHANWGGKFVHFGNNVYANFNLTMVDDTDIYVGDNTLFGPNVTLTVAGHPVDPELRQQGLQYNFPIHIGKNCWLGANVTVLPGVTIGDNCVIGAGSVVTKDIPSNSVAYGTPCKVARKVNERDKIYYFKDHKIEQ